MKEKRLKNYVDGAVYAALAVLSIGGAAYAADRMYQDEQQRLDAMCGVDRSRCVTETKHEVVCHNEPFNLYCASVDTTVYATPTPDQLPPVNSR